MCVMVLYECVYKSENVSQYVSPIKVFGEVDIDRLLTFLTQYNRFINHTPRPFRRIIDKDMRL